MKQRLIIVNLLVPNEITDAELEQDMRETIRFSSHQPDVTGFEIVGLVVAQDHEG